MPQGGPLGRSNPHAHDRGSIARPARERIRADTPRGIRTLTLVGCGPACDGAGMLYPGPQLRLLILLALPLPVGLGVREWRAGFPDAAERLERFDPEDPAPLLPEPASVPAGPTAAGSRRPGSP